MDVTLTEVCKYFDPKNRFISLIDMEINSLFCARVTNKDISQNINEDLQDLLLNYVTAETEDYSIFSYNKVVDYLAG